MLDNLEHNRCCPSVMLSEVVSIGGPLQYGPGKIGRGLKGFAFFVFFTLDSGRLILFVKVFFVFLEFFHVSSIRPALSYIGFPGVAKVQ